MNASGVETDVRPAGARRVVPALVRHWRAVDSAPSALVTTLACCSIAFWLYYAFLREVFGPLNHDEVYFAHILWLLNEGKRQYVDFYSNHLPTYFQLLKPLVAALSSSSTDLSWVAGVRLLSALIIPAYIALAWAAARRALPGIGRAGLLAAAAALLVFVVLARMVEVRADTFGLLLVNAAWAALLASRSRRTLLAAALLAGAALLFSARAAAMVGILGILLLVLAVRSRDGRALRALLSIAAAFLAAGAVLYLAAPERVALVIRSCFIEPARLIHGVPLAARLFAPERVPLTVLIAAGCVAGWRLLRQGNTERGLLVAVPCAAQLLMVVVDPAPYQYVYGWAAVPAVVGIVAASRAFALYFPLALGGAVLAVSVAYTALHGEPPATFSFFRLTPDAPLRAGDLARLPTPQLVRLLITDQGQMRLPNQLLVRSEVCRRLHGTVLTTFDTHPICLEDALFYWTGLRWPPLVEGDVAAGDAISREAFARMFIDARPRVFIWDRRWGPRRQLLPATREMLSCCYELHEGFALSTSTPAAKAAGR